MITRLGATSIAVLGGPTGKKSRSARKTAEYENAEIRRSQSKISKTAF